MRLRTKYDNLLSLTTNVNSIQSKTEYFNSSSTRDLSYYFVPYYMIPDSLFAVSSSEMNNYLRKNSDDYKQEESRSLNYVYFPLESSKEDSAFYISEIEKIRSSLKSGEINDSTFALLNSDGFNPYMRFNIDQLPKELEEKEIGYISDIVYEDGGVLVYKLSNIVNEEKFKARAKHILLRFNDQNKSEIRSEANRILSLLRNGSDFDETARTYSQDGSASVGGDLGWFSEEAMTKPFEDAVFSRSRKGLIPRIVESEFGYHIINVTQPKTKKSYIVTTIFKQVIPSDNTRNNIYRAAEMFKIDASQSNSDFKDIATEKNYLLQKVVELDKNTTVINSLDEARNVVIWAYDDARDSDDISDVIELNDGYVVAHLGDIKNEGTKKLEDVENSIKKKILDNKKFEYINNLFQDYNTLDDLKKIYDKGEIYNISNIDFNSNSIQNVGFSPKAIGVAFSLSEGELTMPIEIEDGIIILSLNSISQADSLSSYFDYGISLLQANKFTSSLKVDNAVKEFSDIEDLRYKFF